MGQGRSSGPRPAVKVVRTFRRGSPWACFSSTRGPLGSPLDCVPLVVPSAIPSPLALSKIPQLLFIHAFMKASPPPRPARNEVFRSTWGRAGARESALTVRLRPGDGGLVGLQRLVVS